ncbi:MAG: sigma-70 family RNA polymerase sigma factor [Candidatus Peregrinibacteria bacterium]
MVVIEVLQWQQGQERIVSRVDTRQPNGSLHVLFHGRIRDLLTLPKDERGCPVPPATHVSVAESAGQALPAGPEINTPALSKEKRSLRAARGPRRRRSHASRKTETLQGGLRGRVAPFSNIEYIGNSAFADSHFDRVLAEMERKAEEAKKTCGGNGKGAFPKNFPAHLARLCEEPLLREEEERFLFCRYNYLKYRACRLRDALDRDSPSPDTVREIERLLVQAESIKDHIIEANNRLVISLVKKFVSPRHSFDDLLSDGIVAMMHAVEKFDWDRGFRFSTYAYRAIVRTAYRKISDRQHDHTRFMTGADNVLSGAEDNRGEGRMSEHEWSDLRAKLARFVDRLDRREQCIIRSRFALGMHRKVRTFQCLADKLGVSKERVRQLEQRAIAKMQAMAAAEGVSGEGDLSDEGAGSGEDDETPVPMSDTAAEPEEGKRPGADDATAVPIPDAVEPKPMAEASESTPPSSSSEPGESLEELRAMYEELKREKRNWQRFPRYDDEEL